MQETSAERRGYLNEEFRIFHLRDQAAIEVEYHYHDFHKLMFLYEGEVEYIVEGQRCAMAPGDLVIVPRGALHRPVVQPDTVYDREILYLSPDFLRAVSTPTCDLEACFAGTQGVLRPHGAKSGQLKELALGAERAWKAPDRFGSDLLCRSILIQLLITLVRAEEDKRLVTLRTEPREQKSAEILRYISDHITDPLPIESLAQKFYISRYHLMHRFREENGVTIHSYILAKRLLLARDLIAAGHSATDACYLCGCRDYSAFARAYKKQFGVSPRGKIARTLERVPTE